MIDLYIDADACPVKDEALRVADRHKIKVFIVANGGIRPNPHPLVEVIIVPDGPDVADDWIAEHIEAHDICITSDIPLASRCLEKNAMAMKPNGEHFTTANIGNALAMRGLMQDLREAGTANSYHAPFGKKDRSSFLNALEVAVTKAKRAKI